MLVLLLGCVVLLEEPSLDKAISCNSIYDAEALGAKLMTSIPSRNDHHDVPYIHKLHEVKDSAPSSSLPIIVAILICDTILALDSPCSDVMCSGSDFLVGVE